jgi:hypothetical protein
MKHFVVYHNADEMGYSANDNLDDAASFGVLTDKSFSPIEGSRIWLVMGEDTPKRYSLCYWFTADTVESGESRGYQYRVVGTHGERFSIPIPLNDQPWFPAFRSSQGNFAFGLSPITQPEFIDALTRLVRAENSPEPMPPDQRIPDRIATTTQRIIRDTALSKRIKRLHEWSCQLCSTVIELPGGGRYAEAHHLRPLGSPHDGPDSDQNLVCVCPTCHAKLDFGVIPLRRSDFRLVSGHSVAQQFIDYHNNTICGERDA